MSKAGGALLRDIRNMKKYRTMLQSQDVITSAKQLKKIKSSQQININGFIQKNKNQKIKNIDQKLEHHETEIEKNNKILKQLTDEFMMIKEQFNQQKIKLQNEEKLNKLLKQEIQRTNKILRTKTIKVDDLTKIKQNLEKQIESYKPVLAKNDQYIKSIASLRKQIITMQETALQTKEKLDEKQKEIFKIKETKSDTEILKAQTNLLKEQISAKDMIINNYKSTLREYSLEKDQNNSQRFALQKQLEKISCEFDSIKRTKSELQKQHLIIQKKLAQTTRRLEFLQNQRQQSQSKAKNCQFQQNRTRSQLQQLKQKNDDMIVEFNQKVSQCNASNTKIQKANQKIKELQLKVCEYKCEKQKLSQIETRFSEFKLKGRNLETLYSAMLPQIQCPYGHELKQPITIIPCGHNYCFGCKKGYQKDCSQCKGKLKIQAVYRNQLMDDIINIIGGIRQVIDLVK